MPPLQPTQQMHSTLSQRLEQWLLLVLNGACSHNQVADLMHISTHCSKQYQIRVAEQLQLPPGQRRIPHIMSAAIRRGLCRLPVVMMLFFAVLNPVNNALLEDYSVEMRRGPNSGMRVRNQRNSGRRHKNEATA